MNANVDEHAAHAVYAPSSAHRWMYCTTSAEAIAKMGEQEEGEAAAKGTAAHEELERVLGPINGDFVDPATMPILDIDPDHESAYAVALMIAFIRKLPPGRMWVEQCVRLTSEIWGRSDIQHWHEETGILTVPDLKDGFVGVDADAEQLRIYAAASVSTHRLPIKWARLVVVQPNDFRPVPAVKQHLISAADLHAFASKAAAIPHGPKTFVAGEQCTYCPLFGRCEASRDMLANIGALVAGLMTPDQVPLAQRAMFLACKKPVEDAFKKADAAWLKEALGGKMPVGMKLVTTVKHRAWKDEDKARAAVLEAKGVDALSPPTPAQAEKLGIDLTGLVDTPPGGAALAMESDTRKPWAPKTGAEMFAATLAKQGT